MPKEYGRERWIHLELELQIVESYQTWVLGMQLRPPGRAEHALKQLNHLSSLYLDVLSKLYLYALTGRTVVCTYFLYERPSYLTSKDK